MAAADLLARREGDGPISEEEVRTNAPTSTHRLPQRRRLTDAGRPERRTLTRARDDYSDRSSTPPAPSHLPTPPSTTCSTRDAPWRSSRPTATAAR